MLFYGQKQDYVPPGLNPQMERDITALDFYNEVYITAVHMYGTALQCATILINHPTTNYASNSLVSLPALISEQSNTLMLFLNLGFRQYITLPFSLNLLRT
jgi:hypothetical protein